MRLLLALAAALAGCGLPHRAPATTDAAGAPGPEYYMDLGPAEIDVSSYPAEQRRNYETFRQACARCHTLARAVNAPTQSPAYWRYHVARMSLHSRLRRGRPLSARERQAVLDFLAYDSRARKVERRGEFERQTEELKRRFDPVLQKALWDLYQGGEEPGQ